MEMEGIIGNIKVPISELQFHGGVKSCDLFARTSELENFRYPSRSDADYLTDVKRNSDLFLQRREVADVQGLSKDSTWIIWSN